MENFWPNMEDALAASPEGASDLHHGINCFAFPLKTLTERTKAEAAFRASDPLTAYIVTTSPTEHLVQLQHWFKEGYWIAPSSAQKWTETSQVTHLYRCLF